jgi:hypothetical protein
MADKSHDDDGAVERRRATRCHVNVSRPTSLRCAQQLRQFGKRLTVGAGWIEEPDAIEVIALQQQIILYAEVAAGCWLLGYWQNGGT